MPHDCQFGSSASRVPEQPEKPPVNESPDGPKFLNCSPSLLMIVTTMLPTPTTMPAMSGVKKVIWLFMLLRTSASKSLSLSFTFLILLK